LKFLLSLQVSKSEENGLRFKMLCNASDSENLKSQKNLEVDLGVFSCLDEMQIKSLLADSVIYRDLSSIYSVYSLRRFDVLINHLLLKRFSLVLQPGSTQQSKKFKLVFESNRPVVTRIDTEIGGQNYHVEIAHDFSRYFRLFFY